MIGAASTSRARTLASRIVLGTLINAGVGRELVAQETRTTEVSVAAGMLVGVPRDLYLGWITAQSDPVMGPGSDAGSVAAPTRTRYRERAGWQAGLETRLVLRLPSRHFLAARLHAGRAGSTASYSGGREAPEQLERSVRWHGAELVAGYSFPVRSSLHVAGYAGPAWQWWHMDTRGRGRDAIGRVFGAQQPVQWTDRSWSSRGWFLGFDIRYSPADWLSWWLALQQSYHVTGYLDLEAGDRADVRRAVGGQPNIRYERHSAWWPTISAGVRLRLGGRVRRDPAVLAVEALARDTAPPGRAAAERAPTPFHDIDEARVTSRIAELEGRIAAGDRGPGVVGELGVMLALRASAVQRDFQDRLRAEQFLREALRLDPANARYLIALGLVYEKRGYATDARVVLDRALGAVAKRPQAVTSSEVAEVLYRRARTREAHVLDFENLRMGAPPDHPECGPMTAFCMNWNNPPEFFAAFEAMPAVDGAADAAREAMLSDLRRALDIEPAHAGANRMLLAAHARAMNWHAFLDGAARYREAAPGDPWASVFYAAGLYRVGRDAAADTTFRQAIARLGANDRAPFIDLRPLLDAAALRRWDEATGDQRDVLRETYWRQTDPLYLTPWSEHALEHYARITLAHLWFGDPERGIRGWETDRGVVLVRYGRPLTVWQVRRDDALISASQGVTDRATTSQGGGRWIFWNYDPRRPSLIFEKTLGRAPVRHMFGSYSFAAAQEASRLQPTTLLPAYRDAGSVAYQAATFAGEDSAAYAVDVYAAAPAAALGARPDDTLHAGVFVFRKRDFATVYAERASVAASAAGYDARIALRPGIYVLVLEAATADGTSAARSRTELVVGAYTPGPLRVSDLLLGHHVEPRRDPPSTRKDLVIEPYRCVGRPVDGRLALVFEVYGLTPMDGQTRYRLTIATPGAPRTGLIPRLLRGLLRRDAGDDGRLSFERVLDGERSRAAEWLDLRLPADVPSGDIDILVTIEDLQTGETARATRRLPADGCRAAPAR